MTKISAPTSSQNSTTWCVARTLPSKEFIAKQNLLDQGFDVYFPRFKKIRRHARRVDEVLAPLFPGYIFVGMDLMFARWRSVNGTRGVSHLLTVNNCRPASVSTEIIEELKSREISDGIVPLSSIISFAVGDRLRVLEGVFKDSEVLFEKLDDKNRIRVLLDFLGKEISLSLPVYAVEAV